ncbi:transcription termination factor MTERF5, chloroplastic [Trifolium repens]|nr:transcription termination factor MTERF5, chloroplastic [Trifolium repens]
MLTTHLHRAFIYLKNLTFQPKPYQYPSQFSLHFCTNTSDSNSFAVSYLINNFGFSPKSASKLCSTYHLSFKTSQKPDSVLTFFRTNGFSNSQFCDIITKIPGLLSCDPSKRVLPKFQFLLSKGASNSDIVTLVSKNPRILSSSLENHIVPTYELVYRFLQSDKEIVASAMRYPALICEHRVPHNITLLVENGVTDSSIARLLRTNSWVFRKRDMLKLVEELKNFGFNPSKTTFGIALEAKLTVNKTLWEEKVDTFKKWGWSDEDVLEAFRKKPHCMLVSINKINLLMSFWVNQMGWDVLALVKGPSVFSNSLEKSIIPRASVVQFLLKKGLRKKDASLTCPFLVSEQLFLDMFIKPFKESSYLLKLYEEKLSLAQTRDKTGKS